MSTINTACEDDLGFIFTAPVAGAGCDTSYHSEIVAILTADGTPSLEGLSTASRSITCTLITIVIDVSGSPESQMWRLDAGPVSDVADLGQVEPADYDLTSNNKHWVKVG